MANPPNTTTPSPTTKETKKTLVEHFTAAYSELMQYSLQWTRPQILPVLTQLSKHIGKNEIATAILVVLYKNVSQTEYLKLKQVANFISDFIRISKVEARREIKTLISDGLIDVKFHEDDKYLMLVMDTFNAIDHDKIDFFQLSDSKGIESMMEQINTHLFEPYQISGYKLSDFYEQISNNNYDLSLIEYINMELIYFHSVELFTLLGVVSHAFLSSKYYPYQSTEDKLMGNLIPKSSFKLDLQKGDWDPIKKGYIELIGGGLKDGNPKLVLTDKGFDFFFGSVDPKILDIIRSKNIVSQLPLMDPTEIKSVDLFFNENLESELSKIERLLTGNNFEQYQMRSKNKTTGISTLFYGDPGCGKTEFALQLARKTGRFIMKVQITDVLSKWVGESESNLKTIFDDYRLACKRHEKTPILLFNEADQLVSKRMNAHNGVDQMHNGIQNLLLEEMENFDGILIGTTNLETQMDPAFERRWIVKINFGKPNDLAQTAIWKSLLPELNDHVITKLVDTYTFSPGEILNITKRLDIDIMLGLNAFEFENRIFELCKTEKFQKHNHQIMGFNPITQHKTAS